MRLAPKKKSSFVNETPRDEINKKCNPYSPPSVVDTNLPISLSPPPPSETLGRLQFAYGVLFLCGIFFACIVWPFLLSPLGIFDARYHFKNRDVVFSIAGFALALSGYFVWGNWFSYACRRRFLMAYGDIVQSISFLHHAGWLVFFTVVRRGDFSGFFVQVPWLAGWIVGNMLLALFTGAYFFGRQR